MQYNNDRYRTIIINKKSIPEIKTFIKLLLFESLEYPSEYSDNIIQTLKSIKLVKFQKKECLFCFSKNKIVLSSIIIKLVNIDGVWYHDALDYDTETLIQLYNDSQAITLLDWINQH